MRISLSEECGKCATEDCTCPFGSSWFHQMLQAGLQNGLIVPEIPFNERTRDNYNKVCMQATGANKETTQKTRAQRRSAAIMVSSAGFQNQVKKLLHHKTKDTTEAHYTINPAYQAVLTLAGCRKGDDLEYDRVSGLLGEQLREGSYRNLVFNTLPPWFKAWHTHIQSDNYNATEKMKLNIRLFMNDLFESMAEFIEGAAAFRIENKNQHYEFYKFPPFNGEVFESFVNELGQAFANLRPVRANMERSQRYIEVGNVQSALTSASKAIAATSDQQLRNHLRENNATLIAEIVRQTTEGLVPIISTLAEGMGASAEVLNQITSYSTGGTPLTSAPSAINSLQRSMTLGGGAVPAVASSSSSSSNSPDKMDPATWPDSPEWVSNLRLINPVSLIDLYDEWNNGHKEWPPLRLLEDMYTPRGKSWRKKRGSAFNANIRRRKTINSFMATPEERDELLEEFYQWFEQQVPSVPRDSQEVKGWTPIRKFLDEVLRPKKEGYQHRQNEMKKRKRVQAERRLSQRSRSSSPVESEPAQESAAAAGASLQTEH